MRVAVSRLLRTATSRRRGCAATYRSVAVSGSRLMPGTVVVETVESRALAGNPLGDPTARRIAVWLPPSYAAEPARRYPCIYWLAGYAGTGEMFFAGSPWQPGLGTRLDALVERGQMREVIIVAPDGFSALGRLPVPRLDGDRQLRDPHRARAGAGHRRALPHVASADARAIGGKSSGGFGALALAMRHPQLFRAVASHAGDMYFELSLLPELPVAVRTLRRHGGIGGFLDYFAARDERQRKDGADFSTMLVLAQAGAYSPEPDAHTASRCPSTSTPARSTGPSGSAGRSGTRSRCWPGTPMRCAR